MESALSGKQAFLRLWQWATQPVVFLSLFLLLFGLSRVPAIRSDRELDPDESLWVCQAMRYEHDLVPWRSVDTTTSGPLNSLPFFLLRKVLGPLSYSVVHAACFVLLALSVIVLWRALRQLYTAKIAGLGAWMVGLYLIFERGGELGQFSSEVMPTFFFSLALWCFAKGMGNKAAQAWWWSLAALLAGSCPWAKLQAAPLSLCFFAGLCWMTLWPPGSRFTGWSGISRVALVTAGFMATTCIFLATVISAGVWQDFWISYIVRNLSYSDGGGFGPWMSRVLLVGQQTIHGESVFPLIAGLAVLVGGWGWSKFQGLRKGKPEYRAFLVFSFLFWLAALFAVTKPPYMFPHYFLLLVVPTGMLASAVVAVWSDGGAELEPPHAGRCSPKLLWSVVAVVVLQLVGLHAFAAPWKRLSKGEMDSANFRSSLADQILQLAPNAHALGIWGWFPYLYVKSNLMPASRFAICHYVISPHPQRDYFRRTFLEDVKSSRPEIFVDAVTPLAMSWFGWSEKDRIESFPELAQFIHENYHVAMVRPENPPSSSFRVFVLNSPRGAAPADHGTESKP